tara:strand:- start:711 stop:920 length:210 start_codon:yes stop_codon:yes gene_type:complete
MTLEISTNKKQQLFANVVTSDKNLIKKLLLLNNKHDLKISKTKKGILLYNDGFDYDLNYFSNFINSLLK